MTSRVNEHSQKVEKKNAENSINMGKMKGEGWNLLDHRNMVGLCTHSSPSDLLPSPFIFISPLGF